ncbi:hypothetical protein E3N88_26423 [Mikania micrantha]|uniref:Uncharacterized protein n=1 Tax=Mikania micrantha TaxID=192012 RepID=A0A5N6N7M9_9ASTR|nr:hypothetical protein E3N88_26423 [Mikania micrantha]
MQDGGAVVMVLECTVCGEGDDSGRLSSGGSAKGQTSVLSECDWPPPFCLVKNRGWCKCAIADLDRMKNRDEQPNGARN